MRHAMLHALSGVVLFGSAMFAEERITQQANPAAVKEVASGARKEANAAWWGFNEQDATDALQAAIRSKVRKLTVPNMGKPWLVRPLFLESNQEIVFEKGVVVQAAKGAFQGEGDSLFTADHKENITLQGYEAEWLMRKEDYRQAPYRKAEWRHCLTLMSCRNVKLHGLRLANSGGDGIYVGRSEEKGAPAGCADIHIKDVVCDDNYRQGISVICAQNLLVENTILQKTEGTAPEAGIDFEPNRPDEYLINCVMRNCTFKNNAGYGFMFALQFMDASSKAVSIRVENCTSDKNAKGALWVTSPKGAHGRIELLGNELNGNKPVEKGTRLEVVFGPASKAQSDR